KDFGLRDEYAGRLAGLVGVDDPMRIVTRVRGMVRSGDRRAEPTLAQPAPREPAKVDEAVAAVEREVLKIALQLPGVAGPEFDALPPEAFLVDRYRELRNAIAAAGGAAGGIAGPAWPEKVSSYLTDDRMRRGVSALA